jgi:hypothetical protein
VLQADRLRDWKFIEVARTIGVDEDEADGRGEEVNWPGPPPGPGDIAGLAILAAILAVLLFLGGVIVIPIQMHSNWGFGKD